MKKHMFTILINLLLSIRQIKSKNNTYVGNGGKEGDDDRDDDFPDMMEQLQELEKEIKNLNKDVAKYDTIIYILIPTVCIFFLIFVSILIYEFIKRCRRENTPKKLIETTEKTKTYEQQDKQDNYSQFKESTADTLSPKYNEKDQVQNSLQFSSMSRSYGSNDLKNSNNDIQNEKPKFKEESDNDNSDLYLNGAVAPAVHDDVLYNNKNEKFFTNKGDDDNNNRVNISNPFK